MQTQKLKGSRFPFNSQKSCILKRTLSLHELCNQSSRKFREVQITPAEAENFSLSEKLPGHVEKAGNISDIACATVIVRIV